MTQKASERERGQASIMIGMMMLTFILFFAFVVNTGMLVNAKINLQNAADLAAYAGAATQARQLNQISYLNYEMRRQYKKFLFRYYVIGGMGQKSRPTAPGSPGSPRRWSPDGNVDYGVPSVCIPFQAKDNYCNTASLPSLAIPPKTPLDNINQTLIDYLQQLEAFRAKSCGKIGDTNVKILRLWLFNTDPNLAGLIQTSQDTEVQNQLQLVKGLSYGLGLIPRELILRQRLNTLESYVNAPTEPKGLTRELIESYKQNAPDIVLRERSIQAFDTAYNTLGDHSFEESTINLTELLPGDGANLLRLKDVKADFDSYAIMYEAYKNGVPVSNTGTGVAGENYDCRAKLFPVSVTNAPIGVYKDPEYLTYYAVRLKATAKVLFSPFGPMELKAYAAAKPFGSRLAPPEVFKEATFHPFKPAAGLLPEAPTHDAVYNKLIGRIPNLPVLENEGNTLSQGKGWDTDFVTYSMYQKLNPPRTQNDQVQEINQAALNRAYQAAMVPNPWESGKFNHMNDIGNDPFVRNFGSDGKAAIWAPVFRPDQQGQARDIIKREIDRIFDVTLTSGNAVAPVDPAANQAFKDAILNALIQYLDRLKTGINTDDQESLNVVRLSDPFKTRPALEGSNQRAEFVSLDPKIMLAPTEIGKIKTSWNTVNDGSFRAEGRVGYSVKYVSFDSLTQHKLSTNGTSVWTNEMNLDSEASQDVPALKH